MRNKLKSYSALVIGIIGAVLLFTALGNVFANETAPVDDYEIGKDYVAISSKDLANEQASLLENELINGVLDPHTIVNAPNRATTTNNAKAVLTVVALNRTVDFTVNNADYGSVSSAEVTVESGTTFSANNNVITFSDGQTVTAIAATSDGTWSYRFTGWSLTSGTIINNTTAIQANFEQYETPDTPDPVYDYSASFDLNGGQGGPSAIAFSSTATSYTFTIPDTNPTKANYNFLGWNDQSDSGTVTHRGGDSYTLYSANPSVTFHAVWQAVQSDDDDDGDDDDDDDGDDDDVPEIIIRFNDDDQLTENMPDIIIIEDEDGDGEVVVIIPDQTPEKDGYDFEGWTDEEGGEDVIYYPGDEIHIDADDDTDIILYPVWSPIDDDDDNNGGLSIVIPDTGFFTGLNGTIVASCSIIVAAGCIIFVVRVAAVQSKKMQRVKRMCAGQGIKVYGNNRIGQFKLKKYTPKTISMLVLSAALVGFAGYITVQNLKLNDTQALVVEDPTITIEMPTTIELEAVQGSFDSGQFEITVSGNNPTGHTWTGSFANSDTSLTNTANSDYTIPTLTSNISKSAFQNSANAAWGYTTEETDTTYKPIPSSITKNYQNASHASSYTDIDHVYIGVKTTNTTKSGTYESQNFTVTTTTNVAYLDYTLTYDLNGGTSDYTYPTETETVATFNGTPRVTYTISNVAPTKGECTFLGWDTDGTKTHNPDYVYDATTGTVTPSTITTTDQNEVLYAIFNEGPVAKAILGTNGNLNFVYDDTEYVIGSTYTDNLGETTVKKVYDVPTNTTSAGQAGWNGWYRYDGRNYVRDLRTDITSVNFSESFNVVKPTSLACWFYLDAYINSFTNLQNLNTSETTTMSSMFYYTGDKVENFSIDLTDLDTSNVSNMSYMFYRTGKNSKTWEIQGLNSFDMSNVTDTSGMFKFAALYATTAVFDDLSTWDTSNITTMEGMFLAFSPRTETFQLDLSKWNVDSVKSMGYMFGEYIDGSFSSYSDNTDGGSYIYYPAGKSATDWSVGDLSTKTIDLGNETTYTAWDMSGVTNVNELFACAGYSLSTFDISYIATWDLSSATNISYMFAGSGHSATTWTLGDLSGWSDKLGNVVDVYDLFRDAAWNATVFDVSYIEDWDISNATSYYCMFRRAGYNATTWTIGNLSGWNTTKNTDLGNTFYGAGGKIENFDISFVGSWDVSNVRYMNSTFAYAGREATTWTVGNLSGWDTSKVINMTSMFDNAGSKAIVFDISTIAAWNVANVKYFESTFRNCGSAATTWTIGELTNWSTGSATTMRSMFAYTGYSITDYDLSFIEGWNTSSVINMSSMFAGAGYNATTWTIGDISQWNVSNVKYMYSMFSNAGYNTPNWTIGNLSNWQTGNVKYMGSMFYCTAYNSQSFDISYVSTWDTSNVIRMDYMFYKSGYAATNWSVGDLGNWDTGKLMDASYMFACSGYNATRWDVGDISDWKTKWLNYANGMFYQIGYNATENIELDLTGWDTSNLYQTGSMFNGARKVTKIYVGDKWSTAAVRSSSNMFEGATLLVGDNGTAYNASYIDITYARIDGRDGLPGYFSVKNNRSTLNFDKNTEEEVGNMPNSQISSNISNRYIRFTLSNNIPTRADRQFLGWAKSPNAVTPEYAPGGTYETILSETTLYAVWSNSIIYNANGGTFEGGLETNSVSFGLFNNENPEIVGTTSLGSKNYDTYYYERKRNINDTAYGHAYQAYYDDITIPGASQLEVRIKYGTPTYGGAVCLFQGTDYTPTSIEDCYESETGMLSGDGTRTFTINGDTVRIFIYAYESENEDGSYGYSSGYYGYWADVTGTTGLVSQLTSGANAIPTREGYSLMGWSLSEDAVVPDWSFGENTLFEDTTVYAVWGKKLIYDANRGKFSDNETENTLYVKDVPTKTYTSSKSATGERKTSINDTTTYANGQAYYDDITIAGATRLEITITYETESTTYDTVCIFAGTSYTPSLTSMDSCANSVSGKLGGSRNTRTFTIEGDTARIYFKSDSSVVKYGYWAEISGDNAEPAYSEIIAGDYEEPTFAGYNFLGWATESDATEPNWTFYDGAITDNTRVYAVWRMVGADLSYDKNTTQTVNNMPGAQSSNVDTEDGIQFVLSNLVPTRADRIFVGWASSPDATVAEYQPGDYYIAEEEDSVLYAVWSRVVTFDANSGTFSNNQTAKTIQIKTVKDENDQNRNVNVAIDNNYEEPNYYGFSFGGWSLTSTSTGEYYNFEDLDISDGMTVYAKWLYAGALTYNANGGTFTNGQTTNEVTIGTSREVISNHTSSIDESGNRKTDIDDETEYADNQIYYEDFIVEGAETITVTVKYEIEEDYDMLCIFEGLAYTPNTEGEESCGNSKSGQLSDESLATKTYTIDGNKFRVFFESDGSVSYYGYWIDYNADVISNRIIAGTYQEPTRDGYVFQGWSTDPDATTADWELLHTNDNFGHVYAVWAEDSEAANADPLGAKNRTNGTKKANMLIVALCATGIIINMLIFGVCAKNLIIRRNRK